MYQHSFTLGLYQAWWHCRCTVTVIHSRNQFKVTAMQLLSLSHTLTNCVLHAANSPMEISNSHVTTILITVQRRSTNCTIDQGIVWRFQNMAYICKGLLAQPQEVVNTSGWHMRGSIRSVGSSKKMHCSTSIVITTNLTWLQKENISNFWMNGICQIDH